MPSFSQAARIEANEDFSLILEYYKPYKFIESIEKSKDLLQLSHRFALSISQLVERSKEKPENERLFLQELSSDAIHLSHVLFQGDKRAAQFYMRSCVENFWRHTFFKNHPVEYGWLHTRPGYFLTLEHLRDYCKHTSLFLGPLRDRGGNLSNYFSKLSSEVHSTNAPGMVLRPNLKAIRLNNPDVKALKPLVANFAKDILLLVTVLETDLFDAMSASRRAYLMEFFDTKRKQERQRALGT
jgi:hypothetical protein